MINLKNKTTVWSVLWATYFKKHHLYKSKKLRTEGKSDYAGVIKPVVLHVDFVGKVANPMNKKEIAVFSSFKGVLSRPDFGIGKKQLFCDYILSR